MWQIFIVLISLIFSTIYAADVIKICCEISDLKEHQFEKMKECSTSRMYSTESGIKITDVICVKNLREIGSLYIGHSRELYYIPREITKFLGNLTALKLEHTGLKSMTKEDLQQFEELRVLKIKSCHLETLNNDVFRYNSKLHHLSLVGSKIYHVDAGIFKPLQKLTWFIFGSSCCIEYYKQGNETRAIERAINDVESICNHNRAAEDSVTDVKINQQTAHEVIKESTTERDGFLA